MSAVNENFTSYAEGKYTFDISYKLMYKYQKMLDKLPSELRQFMTAQRLCSNIARESMVHIYRTSTIDNETGEITTFSINPSGLYHCKNNWTCPVCSVRLLHKHQHKINRIILGLKESHPNHKGIMITIGVPHYRDESADTIIQRFKDKFKYIRCGNYKRYLQQLNSLGSIKTTEVTYTQNGWNLHAHIVFFIDTTKSEYLDKWLNYAYARAEKYDSQFVRNNLRHDDSPSIFTLSRNADNSIKYTTNGDYISANLISRELTYGSNKSVHRNTSFQLLDLLDVDDEFHNQLYVDFAIAAHKHHLIRIKYSKGIQQYMLDKTKYDELYSKNLKVTITSEVVCSFTKFDWNEITQLSTQNINYIEEIILLISHQKDYIDIFNYCNDNYLPTPYKFEFLQNLSAA